MPQRPVPSPSIACHSPREPHLVIGGSSIIPPAPRPATCRPSCATPFFGRLSGRCPSRHGSWHSCKRANQAVARSWNLGTRPCASLGNYVEAEAPRLAMSATRARHVLVLVERAFQHGALAQSSARPECSASQSIVSIQLHARPTRIAQELVGARLDAGSGKRSWVYRHRPFCSDYSHLRL
jgi:hypothetical protein